MDNKREDFDNIVKPVMKWLAENMHPHAVILVSSVSAELLESSIGLNTTEFLVD